MQLAAIRPRPQVSSVTPRRILHVFSTFAIGGPQRRFAQLANHFGAAFRHIVLPMDGRADARHLIADSRACEVREERFPRASLWTTRRLARGILDASQADLLVTYN